MKSHSRGVLREHGATLFARVSTQENSAARSPRTLRLDAGLDGRGEESRSFSGFFLRPVLDVVLEGPVVKSGFLDDGVGDVMEGDHAEELIALAHRQVANVVLVHELAQVFQRVLGTAA